MNKKPTIILLALLAMQYLGIAQQEYELHFVKNEYAIIIEKANQKQSADDYYWLAIAHNELGETTVALTLLEEGNKQFPQQKKLEIYLSNLYFETGNYYKAKPLLIQYQEESRSILQQLVKIYEFENDHTKAIEILLKANDNKDKDAWILKHLAQNYQLINSLRYTSTYFYKALLANPDDMLTRYRAARYYIKIKQYDSAENYCDVLLAKDSLNTKFTKLKAIASFNKKAYYRSVHSFYKAQELGDTSDFIRKHIGICEIKLQHFDTALYYFQKIESRSKNDFEINYYLGRCMLKTGNPMDAMPYLQKADSLSQPDPKIMESIELDKAVIYHGNKQYLKEIESWNKAYAYTPNPEYLIQIAMVYHSFEKDLEKALDYYEKFLESLPKNTKKHEYKEDEIVISYENVAKQSIANIKKELFFKESQK